MTRAASVRYGVEAAVASRLPEDEPPSLFEPVRGEHSTTWRVTPTPATGPELRDQGLRRAAQADPGWLTVAADVIADLAATKRPFTAEDVRCRAGEPVVANAVGVALRRARLAGLIETAGVDVANRPEAHRRLLRTWRGR